MTPYFAHITWVMWANPLFGRRHFAFWYCPKTVRRLSVWWMRVCVVSSPISHSIQVKMVNLMSLILFYYIQSFYSLKPWDHKSTHNPITWLDSSSDQSYYGFSISSNQCSQPKVFSKWKKNQKKFTIPTYVEDSFEQ